MVLTLFSDNGFTQQLTQIVFSDTSILSNKELKKSIKRIEKPKNEKKNVEYANQVLNLLQCNGYAAASVDSIYSDSLSSLVYIHSGAKYFWGSITLGDKEKEYIYAAGYKKGLIKENHFSFSEMEEIYYRLLLYFEENAYPFAKITFRPVSWNNDTVSGTLDIAKNQRVLIDSIIVKGGARISKTYLSSYLSVKEGMPYRESVINKFENRLTEVSFVRSVKSPELIFYQDKLKVLFFLEDRKASQMDGLVGFLPDNKTGKVLFTGQAHARLQNQFGQGELLDVNWRKLQEQTQDLKFQFNYPFLFYSPFGTDLSFKLYKRDTTFIDLNSQVALQYLLPGNNFFKVFYSNRTSKLLSPKLFVASTVLPEWADIATNLYGIGIKREKLDYRLNPRKGVFFTLNLAAGRRNISKNPALKEELYRGIELKSNQFTADFRTDFFIPLRGRSVWGTFIKAANVWSKQLFLNEALRIGGIQNLRGFDEESIFATSYVVLSQEYRFILEKNSYFFVFIDAGWYENKVRQFNVSDLPYGFGSGLTFETKAGIFSINYALGSQAGNPLALRGGKIHFGLVNYF